MNHTLTLNEVREKGIKALSNELTPTEVARFFQMLEKGEGNYTVEKRKLYKNKSVDDIYQEILASRPVSGLKTKQRKTHKPNAKKKKVA